MGRFKRKSCNGVMTVERNRVVKPKLAGYPTVRFMKELGLGRLLAIVAMSPVSQVLINHKGEQITPSKARKVHTEVRYKMVLNKESGMRERKVISEKKRSRPQIALANASKEDVKKLFNAQCSKFKRMFAKEATQALLS